MVYTLGESLLDIIFNSVGELAARPGGSMLNTAVSLGRSGVEVSMISETGDDETAKIVHNFLVQNSVNSKFIKKYYHQNTSVALAFLNEEKKPVYSIHKSYPEKRFLPSPENFLEEDILAFGSMYSLDPALRPELVHIVSHANICSSIVIFDPNIRSHKIDEGPLKNALNENIAFSNIFKSSDEDLLNIFGKLQDEEYNEKIREINPNAIVIITKGIDGLVAFLREEKVVLPAMEVLLVSTIGAGDAFSAGIIHYLVKNNYSGKTISGMKITSFQEMLLSGIRFATEVCGSMDNYIKDKR